MANSRDVEPEAVAEPGPGSAELVRGGFGCEPREVGVAERVAADVHAACGERAELVPVEEHRVPGGVLAIGPLGDDEDRPGHAELGEDRLGVLDDAAQPVVEGDREVSAAARIVGQVGGGRERVPVVEHPPELVAEYGRGDVVQAPVGGPNRVVAQDPVALGGLAVTGRERRALHSPSRALQRLAPQTHRARRASDRLACAVGGAAHDAVARRASRRRIFAYVGQRTRRATPINGFDNAAPTAWSSARRTGPGAGRRW